MTMTTLPPEVRREIARQALLIRRFEERLLRLYAEGKLNGTVHTCVGQEFSAIGVARALEPEDWVFSTHRGHGHYLARFGDVNGLLAEVMGRATGVCGGIGGSQHLAGPNFYSNGIQGGMTPAAVGAALALQRRGVSHSLRQAQGAAPLAPSASASKQAIAAVFIGDGTLGEGTLYESLNLASRWAVPALFIVENNHYAQSTHAPSTTAGTVSGRATAFGLGYFHADTWDWPALLQTAQAAVQSVREGHPALLEIETYRLNAHSKGDDNRDPAEVDAYHKRDPLNAWMAAEANWFAPLDAEINKILDEAVLAAETAPLCAYRPPQIHLHQPVRWNPGGSLSLRQAQGPRARHADLITQALDHALQSLPELIILGEDIEGPYGGAFKVSKDLSLRYPGRVRNTPISEAAITGTGGGLALAGAPAVVEIMFGDFLSLTFDQLYQHAAKFPAMYNGRARVPLVVRTPMGGRRGYGPTHSQSIEKFFLGIPGLRLLALNNRCSPLDTYTALFADLDGPTLVIENKVLYTRFLQYEPPAGFQAWFSDERFPTLRIAPQSGTPQVTLLCYGGSLEEAEQAQLRLFDEEEILAEILCPQQLFPFNLAPLAESVARTQRLVTIEEGPLTAGFGAEALARLCESGLAPLGTRRLGYDGVIPACAPLEAALLPSAESILQSVRSLFT
ncbi:MAG TPA: thiamine pyrophosphate-dependent enzyme [Anaerolineaceae bacterium]|nr:thiamine pyrophosphate-dependent enzyme [Anaerolineaceae bacterium]